MVNNDKETKTLYVRNSKAARSGCFTRVKWTLDRRSDIGADRLANPEANGEKFPFKLKDDSSAEGLKQEMFDLKLQNAFLRQEKKEIESRYAASKELADNEIRNNEVLLKDKAVLQTKLDETVRESNDERQKLMRKCLELITQNDNLETEIAEVKKESFKALLESQNENNALRQENAEAKQALEIMWTKREPLKSGCRLSIVSLVPTAAHKSSATTQPRATMPDFNESDECEMPPSSRAKASITLDIDGTTTYKSSGLSNVRRPPTPCNSPASFVSAVNLNSPKPFCGNFMEEPVELDQDNEIVNQIEIPHSKPKSFAESAKDTLVCVFPWLISSDN